MRTEQFPEANFNNNESTLCKIHRASSRRRDDRASGRHRTEKGGLGTRCEIKRALLTSLASRSSNRRLILQPAARSRECATYISTLRLGSLVPGVSFQVPTDKRSRSSHLHPLQHSDGFRALAGTRWSSEAAELNERSMPQVRPASHRLFASRSLFASAIRGRASTSAYADPRPRYRATRGRTASPHAGRPRETREPRGIASSSFR